MIFFCLTFLILFIYESYVLGISTIRSTLIVKIGSGPGGKERVHSPGANAIRMFSALVKCIGGSADAAE